MTAHSAVPEFVLDALEGEDPSAATAAAEAVTLLADALPPVTSPPELRKRLLDSVNAAPARFAPFYSRLELLFDLGHERLLEVLSRADDEAAWEATPLPGVMSLHFDGGPRVQAADTGLIRVPPSYDLPRHTHLGHEHVLLLDGSYTDETGREYRAGDVHEMAAGTAHSFRTGEDGCVYALVLYEGVSFG